MTNGTASAAERHPPTATGAATDPSKQKAPQQPGPQPDEPKPQKQSPAAPQPPMSAKSSDSKAAKVPLQAHANGGPPEPAPAAADVPATAEWTDESQQMLVKALKEIGKEIPDRCVRLLVHLQRHVSAIVTCLCNFFHFLVSCFCPESPRTQLVPFMYCLHSMSNLFLCCTIMPDQMQNAIMLNVGGKEWQHWCLARLGRSARSVSES